MLYAFQKCKHQLFSSTRLISIKFSNVSGLFGAPCVVEIEANLQSLKQEFERYFPRLANTDLPKWKLVRNLFRVEVVLLPNKIQEEF